MKKLILFSIIALFVLTTFVYAEGFLENVGVIGTLGADSLSNIDIGRFEGKQADYRFTASHTGDVEAVTIFLIYKIPGYAAGDGGDVFVELKTDDGSGFPSETVLASYLIEDPMAENFPVVYFDQIAHLEEGEVYHIEFSNPSPDPVNNYVGVDVVFDSRREANSQPHYSDDDYAVLWKPSGQYEWELSEGTVPVFSVHFTDGSGQGIGYMDAFANWDLYDISGDDQVRETMTFPADKTIDSMYVRVSKYDNSGDLTLTLEHDDGTVLEECTIAAEEVEPDRDWSGQSFDHNMVWTGCEFDSPQTLLAEEIYNFKLTSPGTFYTFGIQDGAHIYNFHPDSTFDAGDFEFSTDNGDTWEEYRHSDVQFYFNMAEPEPVPVCTDDDQDGYYLEEDCSPVDCDDQDDTLTEEITYYLDNDGDGLGDPNSPTEACSLTPPIGYVADNNDQNDNIDDSNMDDVLIVDTGSSGIPLMVSVLEDTYNVDLITIEDVMQGVPADTEVLVWPGGVSFLNEDYISYTIFPFSVYINPQITTSLQNFVNSGGGYVGICAGSIIGTTLLETEVDVQDVYPEFPFSVIITEMSMAGLMDVNAVDYLEWYDNYAGQNNNMGTLDFNDHPIIGDYNGGYIDYYGGPVFKDYENVEVIATFTQQLEPNFYTTVGEPAIVVQDNIVLSSVHPEYDLETQLVFYRMVQQANGEIIDIEPECEDDNECDAGYTCDNYVCVYNPDCEDDADCDQHYSCQNYECVFSPECINDNECDDQLDYTDNTCENNECVYTLQEEMCYDATNCDDQLDFTDNTCEINTCVYILQEGTCYDINDCGDGYECLNDVCTFVEPECVDNDGDGYFEGEDCSPVDCNDQDASITELQTYYLDNDGDGYGDINYPEDFCSNEAPSGYTTDADATDCDDDEQGIHEPQTYYVDADDDGYGDPDNFVTVCLVIDPLVYVLNGDDCDDDEQSIHEPLIFYADEDGDGYGNPDDSIISCSLDLENYVTNPDDFYPYDHDNDGTQTLDDCNDFDPLLSVVTTFYTDADGDTYGDINSPADFCLAEAPEGFTTYATDCDDTEELLHEPLTFYADEDGDGLGNPNDFVLECELFLEGHESNADDEYPNDFDNDGVETQYDCDDLDPLLSVVTTFYADADLDTYGDINSPEDFCLNEAPTGFTTDTTDCDDLDATIWNEVTYYFDNDGDGYGDPDNFVTICSLISPEGYVDNNLDDDDNGEEYLSYEIYGDNIDNDGDGIVDEYNTLDENEVHPEYGDNDLGSKSQYSQSVVSVEGIEDGDIMVTYADNSIYVYDIYDVSTNEDTKFYSSGPRGYFFVLHPTERQLSLVNIFNGDTLWNRNLSGFFYSWLDSAFYTNI